MFLRLRGFRPSINDSPALWAFERWRGAKTERRALYLLGKSRIQNAIDPDAFTQELPDVAPIQLAVPSTSPVGTLVDLTTSSDRPRWVVCSIEAYDLVAPPDRQQTDYLAAFHRGPNFNDISNVVLCALANDRFAALRSEANVRTLATRFLRREGTLSGSRSRQYFPRWYKIFFPASHREYFRMRSWLVQHGLLGLERWPPPPEKEWERQLKRLADTVQKLRRRGTRVAFVRMPTTGRWWQLDETRHPKRLYWDRLAKAVGTIAIHFSDYPELRNFKCPDSSHLDARDQPRFTRALIDVLRRKGFFDEPLERTARR